MYKSCMGGQVGVISWQTGWLRCRTGPAAPRSMLNILSWQRSTSSAGPFWWLCQCWMPTLGPPRSQRPEGFHSRLQSMLMEVHCHLHSVDQLCSVPGCYDHTRGTGVQPPLCMQNHHHTRRPISIGLSANFKSLTDGSTLGSLIWKEKSSGKRTQLWGLPVLVLDVIFPSSPAASLFWAEDCMLTASSTKMFPWR